MRFVPFTPEHAFAFEPQAAQRVHIKWMTPEIAELAAGHYAFTGIDDRGRIVGSAGIAPLPSGDLCAWAVFSELIQTHAFGVTRAVRLGLDLHATRKIVAHVGPSHVKAAAFAERLSFKFEARAAIAPDGDDVLVYVREPR